MCYGACAVNWRERWYHERGLPYEPPPILDVVGWMCVGRIAQKEKPKPQKPVRDDDERAA